ncbi:MAG: rRNA maturation RNase YbeY [Anaerolineae bacterium]|jgi:probable rRNA maturation factor|nr:rRNA maturation RNase YbeY [Anaerolineae bacterium]
MSLSPNIEILNDHQYLIDETRLHRAASIVLEQHDQDAALTIVITNDDEVRSLNRQFRGIDTPTDVLSFPSEELPEEIEPLEDESPYIGDLVIAYPYALSQAQREHHLPQDSFDLLVVHGTLHLLGYDHDTPEHKAQMWAAQERALIALAIPVSIVPALEGDLHDESGT